jgi:quercetin dioxygenase-like cupin family protein
MALAHASAGTVVYAGALGANLAQAQTATLVNEPGLQVFRLVMDQGKVMAEHSVPEHLVMHCLEGAMVLRAHGSDLRLAPGDLCHLLPGEPHAVTATTASSALVTLVGQRSGAHNRPTASEEPTS